ncbi:MAG: SGNH/GDSL hydrolase family protein [Planctomycetota bacterium]
MSEPASDATRPRGRRRRAVVVAVALVFSPLVAEIVARATGVRGLVLHDQAGRRYAAGKPPLPHRLLPGGSTTVVYRRRDGTAVRSATMTVNAAGFRGPLPADGDPRIVCIGDSHTFGFGVDDGEPWPRRLEDALHALGVEQAEVLNLGVGGYESPHELVRLRDDAFVHAPDIVVWQWFVNDLQMPAAARPRTGWAARLKRWTSPWNGGAAALRRHSVVADHVLQAMHASLDHGADQIRAAADSLETTDGWAEACSSIRAGRDAAHAHGAEFVVVVFPLLVRDGNSFLSRPIDLQLLAFCEREGIPAIDLAPALPHRESATLRNSAIDYHPSPRCHALAGRAIAAELVETLGERRGR